jgi:Fic family protein
MVGVFGSMAVMKIRNIRLFGLATSTLTRHDNKARRAAPRPQRGQPALLSLSTVIEKKKNDYYAALQQAQSGNEISEWIDYFVRTVLAAQTDAETLIDFTLKKNQYFDRWKDRLSERQTKVIRRMLEEGPGGFQGGMNASKYTGITKASKATATRDLQDLLAMGAIALLGEAGGRSTSYRVNL